MKVGSTTLPGPGPAEAGLAVRDIHAQALFEQARQRRRRRRRVFATIVAAVLITAAAVIGGRSLVGHKATTANTQPPVSSAPSGGSRIFIEQSGAMQPTLLPGDRVSAVTGHSLLRIGDVVVFLPPKTSSEGYPPGPEIKRIIGLPGARISSSSDTVLINGRPLAEPYPGSTECRSARGGSSPG